MSAHSGYICVQNFFSFEQSVRVCTVKRLVMSQIRFPMLIEIIFFAIADEQVCGACHRKIIVKGKYILCLYYEVISLLLG